MAAPERKPDPTAVPETQWLSAADCAARTGLTVRALRVYERHGLIRPPRSAKGWRRYGEAELTRLNNIVILKALGLTLAQIKTVLADSSPSLPRILQIHAESWREKRDAANRALALVAAAQARLRAQRSLSIDELCELIQRVEIDRSVAMKSSKALMRTLINENITPEEERAWLTWWAENPDDSAAARGFGEERKPVMEEARRLMQQGVDPGSEAAQALFVKHNELLLKYGAAERNRRQVAWDRDVTRKWLGLGFKKALQDDGRGTPLTEYWAAIVRQSPSMKAIHEILLEVRELLPTQHDPAAAQLDRPVARLHEICAAHGLGETLLYVEWRRFTNNLHASYATGDSDLFEAEWEFMERALRARQVE